ncbi:uncharacterized protein DDB_G0271670-like isoform X1 [Anopheles albimanus]|uniref:uncharacterized protein DDB_G0271670-like isoform X1 n=1 Tax=Anopheles albimanus TaxID=7167 RepID=UPI001641AC59|nr:uncharacterized protein DDB_G0271670-like isoform X1 [Anopheles albimanus]
MDCQGPTTAVRAAAVPASVGSSRLAQMQMRFQQRQQQERDQRKIEQIATRTTVAAAATSTVAAASNGRSSTSTTTTATVTATAISSSSAASGGTVVELSERLNATSLSSSLGAGKVRQMFEERRHHRVAGIDKSYPLQPIQAKAGVAAPTTTVAAASATTLANIANGNHSTAGANNNNIPNGATADGTVGRTSSIAKGSGGGGTTMNNKPRVPPISATSRNRLQQQQQQTHRANSLRQEQQVTRSTSNVGDTLPTADQQGEDGGFDDNDNFLELEKFPDSGELDGELLYNQVNNNVNHLVATSANGTGTTRTQNVNSLKLKPVPGRSATTTTTPARSSTLKKQPSATGGSLSPTASMPRSVNGSGKSGVATANHRATKSNGPSRTVTQPSPASSAGSVRRVSSTPPERTDRTTAMLPATNSGPSAATGALDGPVPDGLTRCDICSRNFADDRIEKHRTICQKTKAKKRKVFDVTKQRVAGTEAEKYVLKARGKGAAGTTRKQSNQQPSGTGAGKQSNWRKKHEEFIATIRAAKELKAHLAKGGKLSDLPPPPPSENPDYVQCPHCSRRFNQTAADRHIPKCATMLHNKPKPKPKASTSTLRRY